MTVLPIAGVLLGVTVVGSLLLRALAWIARPQRHVLAARPHLGGLPTVEHAVSRFHVRWYTLALVFLAFDMEMVFMYPWALVVARSGVASVVEMGGFLVVLGVGVLYAWREGALRWS